MAAKPAYCLACGESLKEEDRFCPKCGNATSASAIHTRSAEAGEEPEKQEPKTQEPERTQEPAPPPPPPPPQQQQPGQPEPPPPGPERTRRKPPPTPVIAAAVAGLVVLIAMVTLVAINWAPEERIGEVSAPSLDPALAGGGLSSSVLGLDPLAKSLRSARSDGYELVLDAVDENVIDEFQAEAPGAKWTSEYALDEGALTLSFDGGGGNSEFFLDYQGQAEQKTADEIFEIARRYGFYTTDTRNELTEIEDRLNALIDTWNDRSLTEGVAESDIATDARAIAADLDQWLDDFGDFEVEVRAVEAERAVALQMAEVAEDPSDTGLDEYNRLLDEMNDANDAYNDAT